MGEPEERRRFLGFPVGGDPYGRPGEEAPRILGMPANWFGPVDVEWFRSLLHPVRTMRLWRRRARLGPYALDDDEMAEGD